MRRLYESLLRQSWTDLEWLIVDDGSEDGTAQLIREFQKENILEIRYIQKKNGGKHTALNVGVQEAHREYFLCVDSDDFLADNAMLKLMRVIQEEKPQSIIAYKKELLSGKRIGQNFPDGLDRTTLIELINSHKCGGDRTLVFRTEIIQKIRIPEPMGQRFFPETYLYDRVDEHYTSILLREDICVCEYLSGGYSDSFRNLMIENALSMKIFFRERIDMNVPLQVRYDAAYRYIAFSLLAGCRKEQYNGQSWWLLWSAVPTGLLMYFKYAYHKKIVQRNK